MVANSLRQLFVILSLLAMFFSMGCQRIKPFTQSHQNVISPNKIPEGQPLNPLPIPLLDRHLVMDEIADEIDNFFPVLIEQRMREMDGILSEGWIETRPKIGGQVFEPWKRDSTRGFERLHATLQSVRRFAKVRVIPAANNYLVDVKVYKELEDLPQPVGSSVSGRPVRSDNSLDIDRNEVFEVQSQGWIPLGRDFRVENLILRNIQTRFYQVVDSTQPAIQPGSQGYQPDSGEVIFIEE